MEDDLEMQMSHIDHEVMRKSFDVEDLFKKIWNSNNTRLGQSVC